MPLYVPDPDDVPAEELIEQLGAELAARYAEAEDELIRQIARRAYRDIAMQAALAGMVLTPDQVETLAHRIAYNRAAAELQAYRAQAIRDLRFLAIEVTNRLRALGIAEEIVRLAAAEGEAAAAAALSMARRLPYTSTLTGTATQAVTALALDLRSRLEAMNWRITRYPQDAYQRIISMTAPMNLLGAVTGRVAQQRAVERFLGEGITGFVDKSGRGWRIGSYAEMAGRTATRRAYEDASVWRMQQGGLNLVTIVGGADACKVCAPWIGKILSTDGTTGTVTLPHATRDEVVQVTIYGTLDAAKASGWGHPNCRCRPVAYLPGLSVPQSGYVYSAEAEKARADQRSIERKIRQAKRDASVAGDDLTRKRAEREVRELQAEMREFLADKHLNRQSYREQLNFSDGK